MIRLGLCCIFCEVPVKFRSTTATSLRRLSRQAALSRLTDALSALPPEVKTLLTLENDDQLFSPADLLPVCRESGIPMVYDVHHHRCLPDRLSEEEASEAALSTWLREPLFHISSPRNGWNTEADPKPHHDIICSEDFPACWEEKDITVEVEAKAKELAVEKLRLELVQRNVSLWFLKKQAGSI